MKKVLWNSRWKPALAAALVAGLVAAPAVAQTIIDEWASVKAPPAPELKPVTIDAKTTAFLVLDLVRQTCNNERRPRCIASIPRVQKLLADARAKGLPVIYSLIAGATAADIVKELAPTGGEAMVTAVADKFIGTDLERILREKGIKTVIAVGTAAQGAILYTASAAAMRGIQVVVPVDGMSAENTYAEQYTTWQLANAPTVSNRVTLTKIDLVRF